MEHNRETIPKRKEKPSPNLLEGGAKMPLLYIGQQQPFSFPPIGRVREGLLSFGRVREGYLSSFYLPINISSTLMSLGDTPGMRLA